MQGQLIRQFLQQQLPHEEVEQISDTDSLIFSGRIDSMTTLLLIDYLEQTFDVNFGLAEFTPDMIDSIDAIIDTLERLRS